MKIKFKKLLSVAALVFVIPILFAGCYLESAFFGGKGIPPLKPPAVVKTYGDLSIHFLELNNMYAGDCVYISYGETDILIDAGSRQGSAATINNYLNKHVTNNTLDFVIATHADQDHIAGFYGNLDNRAPGGRTGVMYNFDIDIIIDYPRSNSTSAIRGNYENNARAYAIANGATHYNALQCFNEEDGAKRIYDIGDGIELEIMYNYYYSNYSYYENNYSVVVMIRQGKNQYLFTGDLEYEGESHMVDYYKQFGGIGHCVLYKAGHHGSVSSSTNKLLDDITPKYVVVMCVAGDGFYTSNLDNQFPTKSFLIRIGQYTDEVYVTTEKIDNITGSNQYKSMNGDIVFLVSNGEFSMTGSNNSLKLKDTEWFQSRWSSPWPLVA